ncbi:MAG: class I mannose-6-phosphate isomerase [Renibacterium sp.]|nr:class I mannose-6-phosphate isomerase [Renibacterium sp.]
MSRIPNYDRFPSIRVPGEHLLAEGARIGVVLDAAARAKAAEAGAAQPLLLIDSYPGVEMAELRSWTAVQLPDYEIVDIESSAARSESELADLFAPFLTDDRVFGVMSHFSLESLYLAPELALLGAGIAARSKPTVVLGWGAALCAEASAVLVLADLPRWEIQQRQRRGAGNWRAAAEPDNLKKFKRGYFVEWRIADRHKNERVIPNADFLLDTVHGAGEAVLTTGEALRQGLREAVRRPFRVVPFFDPGVWGGQWMKQTFGLDPEPENFAWCFDCVPEENSLLLTVQGTDGSVANVEIPAQNLVLQHPGELLGALTRSRFGAEFPIRFDMLDTMGGGNLSLQVHPLTEYINSRFGMSYTQDESYYLLDAEPDAVVYLGLTDRSSPASIAADLRAAEAGERPFPAEAHVNTFAARKHDHFSIPAGTVHCSGAGSMVLEISATPYIFTFKMWDWQRLGLDGRPRPIHLEHALANLQWDRRTDWTRRNLVNQVQALDAGPGWRSERTGLAQLEFIEVQRHWFSAPISQDTQGTVRVLNLVEGAEVLVESPDGAFAPFPLHYAETCIVPAAVGRYRITPVSAGDAGRCGVVTAWVRGTECAAEAVR